jgi:hypothetical protein
MSPRERGLAAVDRWVADVLALHDVDDVFGDVGGVVADALEVFGDEDQLKRGEDDAGVAHHVGEQFAEDLVAVVIDLVVHGQDFLREINIAADDGVQRIANHLFGNLAHARQVDVRLYARMAQNADGGLGDVDGLVADALEIVVDARDRENQAEIDGHQLVEREKLDDAVVDFDLQLVDGVFFIEDAFGELLVRVQDRMHGLVDGALGEAAHPQEALFELVQIFFEVAFHDVFPLSAFYCLTSSHQNRLEPV